MIDFWSPPPSSRAPLLPVKHHHASNDKDSNVLEYGDNVFDCDGDDHVDVNDDNVDHGNTDHNDDVTSLN